MGLHSTMVSILASASAALSSIPSSPKIFRGETIVNVAKVYQKRYQKCCLGENAQWLENVDRTHLVLASGKQVLQKRQIQKAAVFINCYGGQCH